MFQILISSLALVLALSPVLEAADVVDYSGLVRVADDCYLTVSDRKNRGNQPETTEPRLGILTVTPKGTAFQPLEVKDWRDPEGAANDLEACCAVPGRDGEYFAAESGQFRKKFGRLFHLRLTRDPEGFWEAVCLGVLKLSLQEPDAEGSTWDGEQVEGIACVPRQGKLILVLGERGGKAKAGAVLGRLIWGEVNLASYIFAKLGDSSLVAKSVLGGRDCSDLRLEQDGDNWTVWSVAAIDTGSDIGPYRSVIYRAGTFITDPNRGEARFDRDAKPEVRYEFDGLKVEALAAPAKSVPNSVLCIGTDDEAFGGIWRPLFARP